MDVVFAKAVPSPKHHYSRLLHKEPQEDFFEAKQAASPRLYTARGVTKGHRRTSSEVPPEEPASLPTRPVDSDLESLSSEAVEVLMQKEGVYEEVLVLVRRLRSERDEAREAAKTSREESCSLKLSLEEAESRRREAEEACSHLRLQLCTSSPTGSPRTYAELPRGSSEKRDRKLTSDPAKHCEFAPKRAKEPLPKAKPSKPKTPGFVLK